MPFGLRLWVLGGCASTPSEPAIIDAIFSNDTARVQSLLSSGANPRTVSNAGNPALALAAQRNNHLAVDALLAAGANINSIGNGGLSVLAYAVRSDGDAAMIQKLVDRGASLEAKSDKGWTALLSAARYRDVPIAQLLVNAGADLHAMNNANYSALHLALVAENVEMADYLLSVGASIDTANVNGQTIRQRADKVPGYSAQILEQQYQKYATLRQLEEVQQRISKQSERDAALPANIRRDKYLVAFSTAMKELQYVDAHYYAQLLELTGLPVNDSLYYFWGDALLNLGVNDQALEKLSKYLQLTGTSGQYYAQTLGLMLKAE